MKQGDSVGPYRIVERLGGGGMGEVYRAKDLKLGRDVAIKVLRDEFATDPDRLKRFEQEARSASALNHPNIITTYDIGKHEATPYISMEFVEGETLREVLAEGPLPTKKLLKLATQMADGLAKAHSAGIVHRDLKPENVMVTNDGFVKILDFGLAKLMPEAAAYGSEMTTMTKELTREGVIVGTIGYMSPEQGSGRPLDHRSDQFSFGAILYEMATGEIAFKRETAAQALAAIIEGEPQPIVRVNPKVPVQLRSIVERCLAKDPEERYESTRDLATELERFREIRLEPPAIVTRRVALAAVALVGAALVLYFLPNKSPDLMPRTVPLTSLDGAEYDPALSPDGKQVAFVWDEGKPGGAVQLFVKLVGGTELLQLTEGPEAAVNPAWSPDGREIAFLRVRGWAPHQEVYVVSALGGEARRLTETNSEQHFRHKLAWSPDGESLAIVDNVSPGSTEAIFLLSLQTGKRRKLTSPPSGFHDANPTFSPDGETVAFIRSPGRPSLDDGDVHRIPASGGEETRVTMGEDVWILDWTSDGRGLVFSNIELYGSSLNRVARSGGEAERLPFGENASSVTVARSGNRLAYAQSYWNINLWRTGGPTAESPTPPERLVTSTRWDTHPQYAPDGSRLAFATTRSGAAEIWICDDQGKECGRLAEGWQPAWSPDGRHIAFTGGTDPTNANPYVIEAAGGFPRRLTPEGDEGRGVFPSWSRDGSFVYFSWRRTGRPEIWKVAVEGGKPQQVTHDGGVTAVESEDGRYLYFTRHTEPRRNKIWRVPVEGGEATLVLEEEPDYLDWTLWRHNIVYVNPEGKNGPAIELFDLDTREVRELLSFPSRASLGGVNARLTVSPNGQWLVYPQVDEARSDLMLAENFR
jgi:Tol biopolymer transport system component/predicted Ser/Thr protein kinase